jgi:hypothetical protein
MKIARAGASGGGGGTNVQRRSSIPNGMTSTLPSNPVSSVDSATWARLGTTTALCPAQHQASRRAIHAPARVGMLGHDHRRSPRAEQAGHVGQGVGVMYMDDVGALPRGGDVARRDLLRAKRSERERASDRGTLAPDVPGAAQRRFDGHDLDLVPQARRTLGQPLDHTLHAPGARPVVLRKMKDAHIY